MMKMVLRKQYPGTCLDKLEWQDRKGTKIVQRLTKKYKPQRIISLHVRKEYRRSKPKTLCRG